MFDFADIDVVKSFWETHADVPASQVFPCLKFLEGAANNDSQFVPPVMSRLSRLLVNNDLSKAVTPTIHANWL